MDILKKSKSFNILVYVVSEVLAEISQFFNLCLHRNYYSCENIL